MKGKLFFKLSNSDCKWFFMLLREKMYYWPWFTAAEPEKSRIHIERKSNHHHLVWKWGKKISIALPQDEPTVELWGTWNIVDWAKWLLVAMPFVARFWHLECQFVHYFFASCYPRSIINYWKQLTLYLRAKTIWQRLHSVKNNSNF